MSAAHDEAAARVPTLREARELIEDLFGPSPRIFWSDLLASSALGWAALVLSVRGFGPLWAEGLLVLVAAFAFLRGVLFVHELCHLRKGALPGFSAVWNLVVGIPMLIPSFMYTDSHTDHHRKTLYGTIRDPEYLPMGHWSRPRLLLFVLEGLAVPALLLLRFGLLAPFGFLIPPLRRLLIRRASSLVINPDYVRELPRGEKRRSFFVLEALCFLWTAGALALMTAGIWPWRALLVWYLVSAAAAVVNQVRTLAAHLYENEGAPVDVATQLLDSVNVRGRALPTELVFPVGLRFHALHHFVPDMPYHALPEAHRRLMEKLPAGSLYRETERGTFFSVLGELWRKAREGDGNPALWRPKEKGS